MGTAGPSCDLSTGSGRGFGRFVSAPVPLPVLSQVYHRSSGRVIGTASGGDTRVSHQSTFVRAPLDRQVLGALF